jgi:AcrR family transcriptional regulator
MPRWKPDTRERLEKAALDLLAKNGYDATTTAQIADHAGLEKRTFFRYFPDKREVLFGGTPALTEALRQSFHAQPASVSAWNALINALKASDANVAMDLEISRVRRDIISHNAELREREVLKAAQLEDLLHQLLVERGTTALHARALARLAFLVYEQAFSAWLDAEHPQSFAAAIDQVQGELTRLLPMS